MRFLERDPLAAGPMDLQLIRAGVMGTTDKILLNRLINRVQADEFKALLVQSPMGTGKSELVKRIKAEEPVPQKILLVTYRQTQAADAHGKNPEFAHYADLKALSYQLNEQGDLVAALADRARFPKVIVQFDSLRGLLGKSRLVDSFDLVILDESESILAHLSAETFSNKLRTVNFLIETLHRAKRIIALDGHLGQRTFDFLTMAGISCGLVLVNNYLPERPLEFEFVTGNEGYSYWLSSICTALEEKMNCIVYSMSAEGVYTLRDAVIKKGLLDDSEVLVITKVTPGEVKKGLNNVNLSWRRRLVILSPTVEAAVDFSEEWFHRCFIYICAQSTTPRGLDQMKSRVRKLEHPDVLCYVQGGIALPMRTARSDQDARGGDRTVYLTEMAPKQAASRRLGVEECYQFLRWIEKKVEVRRESMQRAEGG